MVEVVWIVDAMIGWNLSCGTAFIDDICLSRSGALVCLFLQKVQGTNLLGDSFSDVGKMGVDRKIMGDFISKLFGGLQ